ncbi:DUF4412 domain-containing protein [Pedobacter sp. Du54]|uniref:DUF4412 domain-containing protein n=1 Tax=Pedobacter anseongensis TaxID=3133439 RepID=UPI0030AA8908
MFKSIKTGVIAAILISTTIVAYAQKKLTEGALTYTATYDPTSEQEAMVAQMPKETKTKFNGNLLTTSFESGPATIKVIMDFSTQNNLVLIDVPIAQMQFAVKGDKASMEKDKADNPKLSDFKATGEKQTINGYNTEKYTYKDSKGASYELWATNDIELPAGFFGPEFKDVKGVLVKYTNFMQGGLKATLTLKSVSDEKVGALSLEVPKGYDLKTMEEIRAMQGGGE